MFGGCLSLSCILCFVKQSTSHLTAEIHAKPAFHRFLIGRNGTHIRELFERTGARIIFPNAADGESDVIILIGQQSAIDKARQELEAKIKDLVKRDFFTYHSTLRFIMIS
jgi:KH domain